MLHLINKELLATTDQTATRGATFFSMSDLVWGEKQSHAQWFGEEM